MAVQNEALLTSATLSYSTCWHRYMPHTITSELFYTCTIIITQLNPVLQKHGMDAGWPSETLSYHTTSRCHNP